MSISFSNDWENYLQPEFKKDYYKQLRSFLVQEYRSQLIFPNINDIFNAFHHTSYSNTKVCIIGQDPYHGDGQAHGLCFSVKPNVAIPPSLQNIYKELHSDLGCAIPNHGYLTHWSKQGVLMLNAVLTVRAHQAGSHRNKGWEQFTDNVIGMLNNHPTPIVFILWGAFAQSKQGLITNPRHFIIKSPHPSPLSAHRGFFGSKPFSTTNDFLIKTGQPPIDWQIPQQI